jgi:ribosomal protein L6P/L9E
MRRQSAYLILRQAVRHVKMLDGVIVSESKAQKDELILEGNDVENVSQSGITTSQ